MKLDFEKVAVKAKLYAEQAVVVTLGFSSVTIDETLKDKNGIIIEETHEDYTANTMKKEFLEYLAKNKISYAVISKTEASLTIALPREDGDEFATPKAREIVHGFFKDGRQQALSMESYYQKQDSMAELKNKLLSPFNPTRREVNKNIAKFKK